MINIVNFYKTNLNLYINKYGIIQLIANTVVSFGIALIYMVVIKNFKLAKEKQHKQAKVVKSVVETFSMTLFFVVCNILILFKIGTIDVSVNDYIKVIATLLFSLGVFINLSGRYYLGTNWGNNVVIYTDHKLIDKGIYKYIRHPLYSSIFLMLYAISIIYANVLVFILTSVIFVPAMYYRSKQEEKELIIKFKDDYLNYKRKTGMFLPKLF